MTRKQTLAFRLQRQHLDRRLGVDHLHGVLGAVGIRNTPPGSASTALAARLDGVGADLLDDALARREVVEVLGPRLSPALVVGEDVGVFTSGAVGSDEASLKLSMGDTPARKLRAEGWTLRAAADRLVVLARDSLSDGPLTRGGLSGAMTQGVPEAMTMWCPSCDVRHIHENLMRLPGALGGFCLVPRSGRTVSYVRTDQWLGAEPASDDARMELVRRFLRVYAPAMPADFAGWALLSVADAQERFAALGDEVESTPEGSWLAEDLDATAAVPTPTGVRLLPPSDPYLLGRDREMLVPDAALRTTIWTASGQPGTVLVDGEIVGTWRAQKKSSTLLVTVSAVVSGSTRSQLDDEAQLVAASRGLKRADVVYSTPRIEAKP